MSMGFWDLVEELGAFVEGHPGPSARHTAAPRALQQALRDATAVGITLPRGRSDSRLVVLTSFLVSGDFRQAKAIADNMAARTPAAGFVAWATIQHFAVAMRANTESIEAAEEAEHCLSNLEHLPPSVQRFG
jgi:hypothetical protein